MNGMELGARFCMGGPRMRTGVVIPGAQVRRFEADPPIDLDLDVYWVKALGWGRVWACRSGVGGREQDRVTGLTWIPLGNRRRSLGSSVPRTGLKPVAVRSRTLGIRTLIRSDWG